MMRFFLPVLAILFLPLLSCAEVGNPSGIYASSIGGFWQGFCNYWVNLFASVNGVVMVAVVVGAIGIFIVSRGKWIK